MRCHNGGYVSAVTGKNPTAFDVVDYVSVESIGAQGIHIKLQGVVWQRVNINGVGSGTITNNTPIAGTVTMTYAFT